MFASCCLLFALYMTPLEELPALRASGEPARAIGFNSWNEKPYDNILKRDHPHQKGWDLDVLI